MKQRMLVRPMQALILVLNARLDGCLRSVYPIDRAHRKAAPRTRALSLTLAVAIFALPLVVTTVAGAQQFSVIYNFNGAASGAGPTGTLIADSAGDLYGTTNRGGVHGYGTVFELPAGGGEKVLYSFTGGADGSSPQFTALVRDPAGNLYGVTPYGGNTSSTCSSGCGVVFRISATTGKERVLYSFKGGADGSFPFSSLIADAAGNFYGTAANGGNFNAPCNTYGCGVIYKLNIAGGETVLYSFTGGADGAGPLGLIRDSVGNLYGTTSAGGAYGYGVVFKLDPAGNETVLYAFTGGSDGWLPLFLLRDPAGDLYGDTEIGGDPSCSLGCGVLFKIDSAGNESTLYSFTNGFGGFEPLGPLVRDSRGNLYGTTYEGGFSNSSECQSPYGCGVVFRVSAAGAETVLHSFRVTDGVSPQSGLLINNGYLYGTTVGGGSAVGEDGVAFEIKP